MCAVSRVIVPAILAGMIAGTLANAALVGWVAGAAVAGLLFLLGRRSGATSCTLPPPAGQAAADSDVQPGSDDEPKRERVSR